MGVQYPTDNKNFILYLFVSFVVAFLVLGVIYPATVSASQHKDNGEGFISDVNPENDTAALRVISMELAKSNVPSGGEIEVKVIVANYGNETKKDVKIKPQLYDQNGNLANDNLNLRPKEEYTIDRFEQGEIKTFTFLAQFNHSPSEQGVFQLKYSLRLTDSNGGPVTKIKPPAREITVVPEGSSTSGTSFIDRRPLSLTTYNLDAFKDELASQKDVIGSTLQIPPVKKDKTGAITQIDVAEGQITSFGAISETDTRNSGVVSTDDGNLSVGFAFQNVPEKNHYLIRLSHDDTQISDQIELNIVDSTGDEIDPNTTYQIPESKGQSEQFDFHLSNKEVSQIQSQGDSYIVMKTMNKSGSVSTVDIDQLHYLSLIGVNQVINLPDSELQVENIEVIDNNYDLEANNGVERPTYSPNEEMIFNISVRNIGQSSYVGSLELRELLQDFTGSRDSVDRIIINPNETRHIELRTVAERSGVHEYVLNDKAICSDELEYGAECPFSVQVRGGNGEIVPRIEPMNESIVAGVPTKYRLTGVSPSDDRIENIKWTFSGSSETYNPENGVIVENTYETPGQKSINAEVTYEIDGQTETADHSILIEVIEVPDPDIKAVYYDIKTTGRSSVRSGQEWGEGIGGHITSQSCNNSCGGEMRIGDVNPQMTDGLSMMVIDKNFKYGAPELEFYGTYDFDEGKYATSAGLEFGTNLSDVLNDGDAVQKFINDVNERSGEQKVFVFVGGGDPSSPEASNFLNSIGANFGGYDKLGDNSSYTYITEVVNSGGEPEHIPIHETYQPSEAGQPLKHNIVVVPVEASESDVPTGRPVYFEVKDEKGSNFYENTNVDYEWSGSGVREKNGGEYAYKKIDEDTLIEVDISIPGLGSLDQSDSKTIITDNKPPVMKAISTNRNIENGSSSVITAAYSYDLDKRIDPSEYKWIVESPQGTSVTPVESDGIQSLVVNAGDVQGTVTATLLRDGNPVDTATINIIGETNADFDIRRLPGLIDYSRNLDTARQLIYNYGTVGDISVSELDLSSITTPIRDTFGKGTVEFRDDSIFMKADSSGSPVFSVDEITDTSSSRFIQTEPINMNDYDVIYMSYKRTFERGTEDGNVESGYISMHLGDITADKFTYGNKGTLRGSKIDTVMTSDVVTNDMYNKRYGVMKLDVSDVTGVETVTVHLRSHGSNDGISRANIYELWAGQTGSLPHTSALFDNNFYPGSSMDSVNYGRSRNGFAMISMDSEDAYIDSKIFSSSIIEAQYNISDFGSSSYRITTGGQDISESTFSDTVETENPGSIVSLSTSAQQRPLLVDNLRVSSDRENTNNNLVLLDGAVSQAIDSDQYTWIPSQPEVVNIYDKNSPKTIAEFSQTGEYDLTLEVSNERGVDQITKTIEVDSVDPEVEVNVQNNVRLGETIPISIDVTNDVSVDEIMVLLGNGEKKTISSPGVVEYAYQNPGGYEMTIIAKTTDGLTSAVSQDIKVDTQNPDVIEDEFMTSVMLPKNVYFDATGTAETAPGDAPVKIVDLSSIIQNEMDMEYTWINPNGTQTQGDKFYYTTENEGNDTIKLQVSTPSGSTQNISIELQKVSSEPTITSFEIGQEDIFGYETFESIYTVQHTEGISSNVSIYTNYNNTLYESNFTGDTSEVAQINMADVDIDPGDLPSSYQFTVEVTDEFGNMDNASAGIYIKAGPSAQFEFIDIEDEYIVGRSEDLDASASKEPYNQGLNYTWDFGNWSTESSSDPILTHVFEQAGPVPVTLSVTDANGDTDTINKIVNVSSRPYAQLNVKQLDNAGQFTFDASNSSVGGVDNNIETYRFDVDGDGSYEISSGSPTINHTYTNEGSYSVNLEIEDQYGYTNTTSRNITADLGFEGLITINTCGNQQGRLGPTQTDCNTEYAGTQLQGLVNVSGNGIQELEIPKDGMYRIKAVGAGYSTTNSGAGAIIEDVFNLTEGQILQMAVGQQGYNNGGAGGTFVATGAHYSTSDPLIVAGGAGGSSHSSSDANLESSGKDGYGTNSGSISGGTNGNGGSGVDGTGGGGFYTDGDGGASTSQGGYAFQNGAMGSGVSVNDAYGGFGGGGVTENGGDEPGGGGGYSGGGGSDDDPPEKAGGGGSYSQTSNPSKILGNEGEGYIEIEYLGTSNEIATDCMEHKERGATTSGIYTIYPDDKPINVYCDMDYDGGGWTLLMSLDDDNNTFTGDSNYWTNTNTLNAYDKNPFDNGFGDDVDGSRKYSTYHSVKGDELRVEFGNPHHSITYDRDIDSSTAYDVFTGGEDRTYSHQGTCASSVTNHPDFNSSIMVLGQGTQAAGVNIVDSGYAYGNGKIRFGFGSDEDTNHGIASLYLGIGTPSNSVEFMQGGVDSGSCGYSGDTSQNTGRDTSAVLWIR